MNFERAVGPDDKIGAGDLLVNGHLGGDALLDLFRRPAPGQQTFALGGGGASGANDLVEMRFGARFKQQWNDDDGERAVFATPGFDLSEPVFADSGMEDGFKFFAELIRLNEGKKKYIGGGEESFGEHAVEDRPSMNRQDNPYRRMRFFTS